MQEGKEEDDVMEGNAQAEVLPASEEEVVQEENEIPEESSDFEVELVEEPSPPDSAEKEFGTGPV